MRVQGGAEPESQQKVKTSICSVLQQQDGAHKKIDHLREY